MLNGCGLFASSAWIKRDWSPMLSGNELFWALTKVENDKKTTAACIMRRMVNTF
jgi:hypothetical protein